MHTVKKARRDSTSKRRRVEQGAGLGDYLFGPSDEAKARVEEIRARWAKLQAWGIAKKLPNTRQSQEFVASFLKEWETSPQVEKITAATTDVMMMDRYAEEYDRNRGGAFTAEPIATTFDVERSSRALKGSAAVDKAAAEAAAIVKEAANDAAKVLPGPAVVVPLVLLGVGVLAVVIVVAVQVRPAPQRALVVS